MSYLSANVYVYGSDYNVVINYLLEKGYTISTFRRLMYNTIGKNESKKLIKELEIKKSLLNKRFTFKKEDKLKLISLVLGIIEAAKFNKNNNILSHPINCSFIGSRTVMIDGLRESINYFSEKQTIKREIKNILIKEIAVCQVY